MVDVGQINFKKLSGLVPCAVQDNITKVVLMVGFMNEEAFQKTVLEKRVTFFSRTRQRLWTKGESSGNFLELVDVTLDCDQDSLLVKVKPKGPVCHTGTDTCFGEQNQVNGLGFLEKLIPEIKRNHKSGSYTIGLQDAVIIKMAQQVVEEATAQA